MCGCRGWQDFGPQLGFGRRYGFSRWGGPRYFTREDEIRMWEEYQKDLEEELADVASRIERLKKTEQKEKSATASA